MIFGQFLEFLHANMNNPSDCRKFISVGSHSSDYMIETGILFFLLILKLLQAYVGQYHTCLQQHEVSHKKVRFSPTRIKISLQLIIMFFSLILGFGFEFVLCYFL